MASHNNFYGTWGCISCMSRKLRIEFFLCHIYHIDPFWSYFLNDHFCRSFSSFDHYHKFSSTKLIFSLLLDTSSHKNHDNNLHKDCIEWSICYYSSLHTSCRSLFFVWLLQIFADLCILTFFWFYRWIDGHF